MHDHTNGNINRTLGVRFLNDQFRRTLDAKLGRVLCTGGVQALPDADRCVLLAMVQNFSGFNEGNDPHKEHDFGRIHYKGTDYFFKIDYFDKELRFLSEDASDPTRCTRIMTVMRADEY